MGDAEIQYQTHRTLHIREVTSQLNVPTSLTPALIHLLCFYFVGGAKEVGNLNHWQTCQVKSAASQVHDWVVYRLGGILGSVGHKLKIHKITPATGKERGELEIKDYVVLQKRQEQADRLPPPRTLILDFTMTHPRYGRSHVHLSGQLTIP